MYNFLRFIFLNFTNLLTFYNWISFISQKAEADILDMNSESENWSNLRVTLFIRVAIEVLPPFKNNK